MTSTQTMEISGKFKVQQETRLLEETYLEKLKDLALSATQDRLVLIDKFGQLKAGPPFESIPPGQGSGGGNPNPQSCSNTFQWEKISGTTDIYNCQLGNVGIGSAPTLAKLDVRGTGYFSGNLGIGTAPSSAFALDVNGKSYLRGLVGVGTNNPESELHVKAITNSNCDFLLESFYGHKWDFAVNGSDGSFGLYQPSTNLTRLHVKTDGNVGIGTTEPSEKLDVNGNIRINENDIFFRSITPDGNHGLGWYGVDGNYSLDKTFAGVNVDGPVLYGYNGGALGVNVSGTKSIALRWKADGKIGIGTTDPQAMLHVKGPSPIVNLEGTDNFAYIQFFPNGYTTAAPHNRKGFIGFGSGGNSNLIIRNDASNADVAVSATGGGKLHVSNNNSSVQLRLERTGGSSGIVDIGTHNNNFAVYTKGYSNSPPSEQFVVTAAGNVGIGTNTPSNKLDVNGTIRAKKVRVDTDWGDYVFDENHQRLSFDEKEKFYKANKHLPAVPSAKEIETDGLDVGDVMKGMIVNIEEDRLDITELYKRLVKLEKENEELKKQIEELKK